MSGIPSPDGIAWTGHGSGINAQLVAIVYGSNRFVASGDTVETFNHGIILTSQNGSDWSIQNSDLYAIAYGEGQFVGIGGGIGTSPDGVHWTTRAYEAPNVYAVAYGNNEFVAVGHFGTIVTSSDGVTWTNRASGTTEDLMGVTYGNNRFVAVSYQGSILRSGVLPPPVQPVLGPLLSLPSGGVQVTVTGPAGSGGQRGQCFDGPIPPPSAIAEAMYSGLTATISCLQF